MQQQKGVCVDSRISIAQDNAQRPHLNVWRVVAETVVFLAAVVCDEADEQWRCHARPLPARARGMQSVYQRALLSSAALRQD